ncbi:MULTISPECIES: tolB protein precursor [unclassified Mucilaginibacter]|uniref:eIF2A-related protein n=1 Tax=unclassified Mucilaginibacter TaxID=2617802 RepID=UPI002AC92232|nr:MULTISPECIES: tolB protein precursor [unclassified Mucilaginibacter]MEB0261235.1 DPP IV N-terminal domain-containing protein [Mucilaginibacter sp. 10I4]MEB0279059.1 DPP IV N-terminal domain-containing protein [Mucilaginibacter sp. 10B2]MEB0299922.1 DPP IV N-terminal domain-containing protein [Mucilaginibacter sp. 5C4]WPX22237.1 tolB protein precursor [Mucilaginibacter sp. 5C4]
MYKRYPCNLSIKYPFILFCLVFALLFNQQAKAQYFGQNKVRYKNLKFKVYKTPHFEIYYYLKNDSLIKRFAQESELWYTLHQQVFRDTFNKPNPIILYTNHPDFQQTTAIDGEISVGTGGITEGLKNRVVMPIMETNQTTRHVLGHELVHAFQYHMLLSRDSSNFENIGNIPLWMVEGMAEYLSLGKKDAYTAMWMRDAYLNHDIPTIRALTQSNKYFPYRYGEAFWSFLGSTYGDTIIVPFFKNTARFGLEYGIRRTLGYDDKTLSRLWQNSIENTYKPYLKDTVQTPVGKRLIDAKLGGDLTVAPCISPDGKYLAFLSSKSLFSIDLYLADAKTGRVIKQLTSKVSNTHIDEFNFIESAGTWSPDSRKFAFSIFSKGRNRMLVVDVPDGRIVNDVSMGKAEQFGNLTWSPDGKNVAFQGMSEGQGDLYMYNFESKKVVQLTNDKFSDYQPNFSEDGKHIIFSSDRATYDKKLSQDITFNLAELDITTGKITNIKVFDGANNLNPQYSSDGKQVYFLSNKDGFRNMYRYTFAGAKVEQMTDLFTGICGITEYSPALSLSNNDDVVYSYYRAQKYAIYNAKVSDFKPVVVDAGTTNFTAAMLPPLRAVGVDLINYNLNNYLAYSKIPLDSIHAIPYKPKFKLDALGSTGVGVSVSSFGTGLASGVQGVFSDILGRNQIYAGVAVNGAIYDFGGSILYINQQGRWNFGLGISHIPYQSGTYGYNFTNIEVSGKSTPVYEEKTDIIRTFEDQIQAFASYPLSRTLRTEIGTTASRYSYRVDRYSSYYSYTNTPDANGVNQLAVGNLLDYKKHKISRTQFLAENGIDLKPFNIYGLSAALVGDDSYFGIAAPLNGHRFRIEAEYNVGTYNFFSPTIDLRKYVRAAPLTFAARLYGYGRFGNNVSGLYPLYVGYPFLIRGYEAQTFYNSKTANKNGFTIDQLSGSRIAVANFEIRLPFTGPEKLAVIKSKFLFTDLNLFFDAGLAWNKGNDIRFQKAPDAIGQTPVLDNNGNPVLDGNGNPQTQTTYNTNQRVPSLSAGFSLRVNFFGAFILEPYFAVPFNRTDVKKPVFGLTFAPGW